ncbi:MAG: DoxX family protein [Leptospira sp.]|nr:DoxX family protein [Leptospira sp.]
MWFLSVLILLSSFSFIAYGIHCLVSLNMIVEFERFGFKKLRILTGILEILGGMGLLVGVIWNPLLIFSSLGLTSLMLVAFGVRVRLKDGILESTPSLILMLMNLSILIFSIKQQ